MSVIGMKIVLSVIIVYSAYLGLRLNSLEEHPKGNVWKALYVITTMISVALVVFVID